VTEAASGSGSAEQAAPTCYRHPDRETWIRCQRCDRPICPDCMRSAAVGFHCPECVKEGARTTRQGRTAYGGQRSGDPRATTFVLIGLNVLVWLAIMATGGGRSRLVDLLALLPGTGRVSVGPDGSATLVHGVAGGDWWQVLTSAFVHISPLHVGFNMVALYFLGPMLEGLLGRARFLALYLVSALVGSAAVMWLSPPGQVTLGASTAIFGLMGTYAVVALKVGGQAQSVFAWIGINLVLTFTLANISWQGHLGGLVGGALIGAAMAYAPRQQRALVQWGATGLVAVLALAAIAARAVTLAA
jgi:membrane associated rhomboid family serine protease